MISFTSEKELPAAPAPPAYSPAASSSAPTTPRVNHLYIIESRNPIKGIWTVDPNIRTPPLLLPEVPEGEQLENLHLECFYAAITAHLSLISDVPTRSDLTAVSTHGSITIHIVS